MAKPRKAETKAESKTTSDSQVEKNGGPKLSKTSQVVVAPDEFELETENKWGGHHSRR